MDKKRNTLLNFKTSPNPDIQHYCGLKLKHFGCTLKQYRLVDYLFLCNVNKILFV